MKKLLSIICILVTFILVGCGTGSNGVMKLKYEPLSDKEIRVFNLTGDKIAMYEIKNIPEGIGIKIDISYELYEGDVKIKEEVITGIATGGPTEKDTDLKFGINIQDNQIRANINMGGGMSSNKKDIGISLIEMSHGFLGTDKDLKLGDEIYIFHGAKGDIFSPIDLGVNIDEELLKERLSRHDSNILIKLSIKEVTE